MKAQEDKRVLPVVDMVNMGFCECDQKLATKCDHGKNKHCLYAIAHRAVK